MMQKKPKTEMTNNRYYYLPKDTLKHSFHRETKQLRITNPRLIFYKFFAMEMQKSDKLKSKYDESVENIREIFQSEEFKQAYIRVISKYESIINDLNRNGFLVKEIEMELSESLCIGLGMSNVNEVGITLHHIYGIPYIPATSIKGITRLYACYDFISKWIATTGREFTRGDIPDMLTDVDNLIDEKKTKLLNISKENRELFEQMNKLRRIFGTISKKASIIFMDSYPLQDFEIENDIINPHYSEYYTKGKEPGDWSYPVPIAFPVIKKSTKFRFVILSKEKELLDIAGAYLENALKTIGIGAKTSLGYGIFKDYNI